MDDPRWLAWRTRLAELRERLDAAIAVADALAAELAAAAASEPTILEDAIDEGGPARARQRSAEVARALAYLAANYARPITVDELARAAGCGRDRLARAVRRETGVTIQTHLVRLRLARAAREVGAGDKIEAVMLGVGYRGKRNFYRQFKARFGMTPGRWRAAAKNGQA
jgi:AraC-like DNA-binding protein